MSLVDYDDSGTDGSDWQGDFDGYRPTLTFPTKIVPSVKSNTTVYNKHVKTLSRKHFIYTNITMCINNR